MKTRSVLVVLVTVLVLASCSKGSKEADTGAAASGGASGACAKGSSPTTTSYDQPFAMTIDPNATYVATMCTSKGKIVMDLSAKSAPNAVNNFVNLAQKNFYNGLIFHRVIDGFMIQGGDPQGSGMGGPGYEFADELSGSETYPVGTVAMANAGPNTNGSQFFIVTGPQAASLPPSYVVIGKVTEGQDVADAIQKVPTSSDDRPLTDVVIDSLTVAEK